MSSTRRLISYTVSQINEALSRVTEDVFKDLIWVEGEVAGYTDRGNIYFDLIEKDNRSNEIKASIKVIIFSDEKRQVLNKVSKQSFGFRLRDGITVKLLCKVCFYKKKGYANLKVSEIDVFYTLGSIYEQRKMVYKELKEKGILEKNKNVPFPLVPQKIGLITAEGSAAFSDFLDEFKKSKISFKLLFYPVPMQGKETIQNVCRAISYLNSCGEVDLVVITRGGGAKTDLVYFDNREIPYAIANSRLPIVVGIGHQIDKTIADCVAYISLKTPTAVATYIICKVNDFVNAIKGLKSSLDHASEEMLSKKTNELHTFITRLSDKVEFILNTNEICLTNKEKDIYKCTIGYLREKDREIENISLVLRKECTQFVKSLGHDMEARKRGLINTTGDALRMDRLKQQDLFHRLNRAASVFLDKNKSELSAIVRVVEAHDPFRIIHRGFAVVFNDRGRPIKEIGDIGIGEITKTVLRNGVIKGNIKYKEVLNVKQFFRENELQAGNEKD